MGGNSDIRTTDAFYLKVSEADYRAPTGKIQTDGPKPADSEPMAASGETQVGWPTA